MDLPKVYVVLEQKGDGPVAVRDVATGEKEAEAMRRYYDNEPKSGRIFVEVYVAARA